ncbi:DUF7079 family protein [Litoribacillus peritrichatus]|uniref:DUF7079 domain-containing protein n=1 Tax=Litoribacillus peritrichatus TaxID=718191 RepID=A0ABP7M7P8_9GAMM
MIIPEERIQVWETLSDLFLDTELTDADLERMAKVLAESPYSIEQLQDILYYEVYPVCKGNLLCVAGEWAFFGREWVLEYIAPRMNKRPWLKLPLMHRWMFKSYWMQIKELIHQY